MLLVAYNESISRLQGYGSLNQLLYRDTQHKQVIKLQSMG